MSKYTTEVRFICEKKAGLEESVGYSKVDEVIDASAPEIFGDFPIFDPLYKPVLMRKILKHYYTREIGLETAGLWQLRLNTRMNEIMPYYNKLYESELIEFNPMYDVDLTTSRDKQGAKTGQSYSKENNAGIKAKSELIKGNESENTNSSQTENNKGLNTDTTTTTGNNVVSTGATNKGTQVTDGTRWDLYSDTPQGDVSGINGYMSNLDAKMYLTNARKNTDEETVKNENVENSNTVESGEESVTKTNDENRVKMSNESGFVDKENKESKSSNESSDVEKSKNSSNVVNNIEDYFERVVGKRGSASYSKLLGEFRDTFLNIDMMIINDLKDLFFYLW